MILEEIYRKYRQRYILFIRSRFSDKAMAEDILQEVFVNLFQNMGRYKIEQMKEEEAKQYIYKCIQNKIFDLQKRNEPIFVPLIENKMMRDVMYTPESLEQTLIDKQELKDAICNVMRILNRQEFVIMRDIFYEGISREEAAKKLGMSKKTLTGKIHRIRKKVNKLL